MATKKAETKKYQITNKILTEGYYGNIENREFAVTKGEMEVTFNPKGKQVRRQAFGFVFENGKITDKRYFTDLSGQQIHELYVAGVITLDKRQEEAYNKFIKTYYN